MDDIFITDLFAVPLMGFNSSAHCLSLSFMLSTCSQPRFAISLTR